MALETRTSAILRFGTFEADLRARELRKQGKRIKLQDQPFQVLAVLLQRPGEVVAREELRSQIWPQDTFVDFDNSLNTAINKLRDALGDSADNPRFIETLPRRGYRFLTSVQREAQTNQTITLTGRKIALIAVVTVLVAAAVTGGFFWHSRRGRLPSEENTIVLGDFVNSTQDTVFDGMLREGLSVELEQSPFLSLLSEEGIHQTLRMMGQRTDARLTPEIAKEVCQRTNSAVALDGSIALIGTRYNLILKAVDCASGDSLGSTEAQASDKSHILDALGKVASEMRRRLGESLSTVQKYNTPLEQATTPSLEALQAYSLGYKTLGAGDSTAALLFFERATELDRNFAMAHWGASLAYTNLGETVLTAENGQRAFELRERLSQLEKLKLECDYFGYVYDLPKARRSCELGVQTYPREPFFPFDLGVYSNIVGEYQDGLKYYRKALQLAPQTAFYYRNIVLTYLLMNRINEALALADEARTKGLDSNFLVPILYGIAFYRDDPSEMARQAARATGKSGVEDLIFGLQADTAAYSGRLKEAREFSRQASSLAGRAGEKEAAVGYDAVCALREALFGLTNSVGGRAAEAKGRLTGRDLDYAVALTFAYAGDTNRAQALAEGLAQKYREDVVVEFNYLPTLRAKLALDRSSAEQALEVLRVASPYELGLPAVGFYNWPNMYPVYVRGEAYLAAHQGREAAAEFQKILSHRGIVLNEPIGVLAHLQLGRAYALQGDTAKARAAYQDFLTLWKDADPDIPILRDAKAEYAKLR